MYNKANKSRMLNKKGISPLIATILIVGFTIALAAIFYGWWSSSVKETLAKQDAKTVAKMECLKVQYKISKESDNEIRISNMGNSKFHGFILRDMVGHKQRIIQEFGPAKSKTITLTLTGNAISAIPIVVIEKYAFPCAEQTQELILG